jgi:mRNA-degrading endonuclease toxin of MazEF toxin-antitoxin module
VERGEVYLTDLLLRKGKIPFRRETLPKYVVILRGGQGTKGETEVPFVIASSKKEPGPPRAFEVEVGTAEGFQRPTIINCRAVYTLPKDEIGTNFKFKLPQNVMEEVDIALTEGLQMGRWVG